MQDAVQIYSELLELKYPWRVDSVSVDSAKNYIILSCPSLMLEKFELTDEQIDNLKAEKRLLKDSDVQERVREFEAAHFEFINILTRNEFEQGNDLPEPEVEQLFRAMRRMAHNRSLTLSRINQNRLEEFNQSLRSLLYGAEPIAKRVDNFVSLKTVGGYTTSHFLYAFDPEKFCLNSLVRDRLEISAEQVQAAVEGAIEKYHLDPNEYYDVTIDLFADTLILEEVKNKIDLRNYMEVNFILYLLSIEEDGVEEMLPFASLSLEKDLEDYIAANPDILESGLTLVKQQYTTPVGRIDILFKDRNGHYLVVETKKGLESDRVIGQISRYVGYLEEAESKRTRGLIIASDSDDRLKYGLYAFNGKVKMKYYKVSFSISDDAPN